MRKFFLLYITIIFLCACASLPKTEQTDCLDGLVRPSFFAQEELAAFRFTVQAHNYGLDGILQIKKQAPQQYEVTVFTAAGGYRLLQASVSREKVEYSFVAAVLDRSAVRAKTARFLKLLLIPSVCEAKCRVNSDVRKVYCKHSSYTYKYPASQRYPAEVSVSKGWGRARLTFNQYMPYGAGELPSLLHYQDGAVALDLALLRLK